MDCFLKPLLSFNNISEIQTDISSRDKDMFSARFPPNELGTYSGVPNKRTGTPINFQEKMHPVRSY